MYSKSKALFAVLALFAAATAHARQPGKGRVLVILSSEDKLTLKNGKIHKTGFFFPELMVPVQKLAAAGYEPVFANPKGNRAVMDAISDSASFFGPSPQALKKYEDAKAACRALGICGDKLEGSRKLNKIADILPDLKDYSAVFVPGGHAPLEDLWKDADTGKVLRYFHEHKKTTALLCHGPVALLSAMEKGKAEKWAYRGYAMTVFTTGEEKQAEKGFLGGDVKFYPDRALEKAGAKIKKGAPGSSTIVTDRELITGQNPASEDALADKLLAALQEK
jgi:putative intracellular protease/amidase